MKTLARTVLFTGVFLIGASGPAWAQSRDGWLGQWYDRWHKAKFGHSSPMQRAEESNVAYRSETATEAVTPALTRYDRWHKAKFGHDSATVEARRRAERESTAFRAEPSAPSSSMHDQWYRRWHKGKFGHSAPK